VEHLNDSLIACSVSCNPVACIVHGTNTLDDTIVGGRVNLGGKVNNTIGLNLNNDTITIDVRAS
jgi:hypothetical protein